MDFQKMIKDNFISSDFPLTTVVIGAALDK